MTPAGRRFTGGRTPPSRRRASSPGPGGAAGVVVRPFQSPDPLHQGPGPLLADQGEQVGPVALVEELRPAGGPVRQGGQRGDLGAWHGARHRAGGRRRVGRGREEPALLVAQGAVHDVGAPQQGPRQPREPVVAHGGDPAVRRRQQERRVAQDQVLDALRRPPREDHRGLRCARVRKVTGVRVGRGGTRDGEGERLGQGNIRERNGQFGQGAAQPCREPGDRMQTARAVPRRSHPVQQDERTALPGGGKPDAREVLVGAGRIAAVRHKFRAHPASLHDPFTAFAKGWHHSPNRRTAAGQTPVLGGNEALREGVAANTAKARRPRPTGLPGKAAAHARGTCPPTPLRCSLLRVAGRAMRGPRTPALGGSGTVPDVRAS